MIRSLIFTLALILSASCYAQFRVDAFSGNCYVRTGEGSVRLVDKTKLVHLPVYKNDGSLHRKQLKKRKIRQGFSRPAVYGQDPNDPKQLIVTRPAQETEILEYYIVNDAWQRCNCAVNDASLQTVANVLIKEGDLPEDFVVNQGEKENRVLFVAALNDYAKGYELKPVLDKAPDKIYIPYPVLKSMYLGYSPKQKLIVSLARR